MVRLFFLVLFFIFFFQCTNKNDKTNVYKIINQGYYNYSVKKAIPRNLFKYPLKLTCFNCDTLKMFEDIYFVLQRTDTFGSYFDTSFTWDFEKLKFNAILKPKTDQQFSIISFPVLSLDKKYALLKEARVISEYSNSERLILFKYSNNKWEYFKERIITP